MFAVLKKKTNLADDYDARIRAPRALRTAALPVVDEDLAFPVEDDENSQAPRASRKLFAALPVVDEDLAFPVEDDENSQAPRASRKLFALPSIDADEDLVPVLDEDAPLPVVLSLVRSSAPVTVDEDLAFPVEEDEGARAQLAPRPLRTIIPIASDEEATPIVIEDEDDGRAPRASRKLTAVPMPDVDDDFPTPPTPTPTPTFFPSTPLGAPAGDYVPMCICAWVTTAPIAAFVTTAPVLGSVSTAKITTAVVSEEE